MQLFAILQHQKTFSVSLPINGTLGQVSVLCTSTLHQVSKLLSGVSYRSGLLQRSLPVTLAMDLDNRATPEWHGALKEEGLFWEIVLILTLLCKWALPATRLDYRSTELCLYLKDFSCNLVFFPFRWFGWVWGGWGYDKGWGWAW